METRHSLYIVSVGPGGEEYLTRAAESVLMTADCLFIARRHLPLAKERPNVELLSNLEDSLPLIEGRLSRGSVAVAVSGDAGIFSFMPRLKKRFPDRDIVVIPGVSALQSLCAALGETWDDAGVKSVHGASSIDRDAPPSAIAGLVAHNRKTVFFCGPNRDPAWLCSILSERAFDVNVAVGERLSYPDERITKGKPSELLGQNFDALSVVMALNPDPLHEFPPRPRDEDFLRSPSIPMTREDVRTIILDRLNLTRDAVLWDIGAGTGSVSVACSQLCPYGEVHAVERLPEAIQLLNANKKKFRAYNLFAREGDAEKLIESLPSPTHVFVGGSGGGEKLRQILEYVGNPGASGEGKVFVAVSGVTLSTIGTAYEILSGTDFSGLDVTQISVSRGKTVGDSMILAAQNPVTLLSAWTSRRMDNCDSLSCNSQRIKGCI